MTQNIPRIRARLATSTHIVKVEEMDENGPHIVWEEYEHPFFVLTTINEVPCAVCCKH